MSTNPDHVEQLAAILREVDGDHSKGAAALAQAILGHPGSAWHPPDNLAQSEEEARLYDLISKLLRPAYEPGDGTADDAQQVDEEWWHPIFGSDSLQFVIDNARELLVCRGRPATSPAPEVGEVGEVEGDTHWLPARAIPLPQDGGGEASNA